MLLLKQTFTDGSCLRFLMKQICYITLTVAHHHRIVFLTVGGFHTVNGRAFLFFTDGKPCIHQLGGVHTGSFLF